MLLRMELQQAIAGRRSVRGYTGAKLDRPTVQRLLEAAVRAPTAVHEEPWRFLIVQDDALMKRVSDRAKVLFAEEIRKLHLDRPGMEQFSRPEFNIFYGAGTLILICASIHLHFAAADCWLAAENLMLDAFARGFGSCVIGSAVTALNQRELKETLGIPPDLSVLAPIIVGVAKGDWPATERQAPAVIGWR